jgi:hypothetical protein
MGAISTVRQAGLPSVAGSRDDDVKGRCTFDHSCRSLRLAVAIGVARRVSCRLVEDSASKPTLSPAQNGSGVPRRLGDRRSPRSGGPGPGLIPPPDLRSSGGRRQQTRARPSGAGPGGDGGRVSGRRHDVHPVCRGGIPGRSRGPSTGQPNSPLAAAAPMRRTNQRCVARTEHARHAKHGRSSARRRPVVNSRR